MRRVLLALCLLACSFLPTPIYAQSGNLVVATCGTLPLAFKPGATEVPTVDTNGNQCISGSISASTTGFAPGGTFANLTATNVSADVALPAGSVVAFQNTGTATVSCQVTVGAGTAVANQIQVPASSTVFVTVGGNTHGSCIDQVGSSSNLVALAGGTGLGTGFGGGGGGGGSGAITTWAGSTLGAISTYGTSPGAVIVPAFNAFVTNVPAVTQSGSWTVQPGNTANTTPWLFQGNNSNASSTIATSSISIPAIAYNYSWNGSAWQQVQYNNNGAAAFGGSSPVTAATINVTPTDCSIALTTGATAQNILAASATLHGFTIKNIDATSGSGEPIWISFTGTAAANTIGSYPLGPPAATTFLGGESYTTPLGYGVNHAISVVAATTGHKISCTTW